MNSTISHREKEVLKLISNELTAKEKAAKLYVINHTIISHRKNLMRKLNAKNTAGLMRRGFERGILRLQTGIKY